eukprot:sb/3464142/
MLTAAHLKYANYDYSLSTFLTEANIPGTKTLTWVEWLRLLGVASSSSLALALSQRKLVDQRSPLEMFLEGVVKSCGRSNEDAGCQTEGITLEEKLRHLDREFSHRPPPKSELPAYPTDIQELIKLEVDRFKELQLGELKRVEKDKLQREFNSKLSDYETEYRRRLDALHAREIESTTSLDKMKAEVEASLYKERQQLLHELEALRSRATQIEREKAVATKQVALEQEKFSILTARLEERDTLIREKEEDLKCRVEQNTARIRARCKEELRDREGKLHAKESQIEEEREEVLRVRADNEALRTQLNTLQKEHADCMDRLVQAETRLEESSTRLVHYEAKVSCWSDYETIKNQVYTLENERKQVLDSMERERGTARRTEDSLKDLIASLRDQLSRPSKGEVEALNDLSKLRSQSERQVEELSSKFIVPTSLSIMQVRRLEGELEREQQARLRAQKELRDQFLECRAHHNNNAGGGGGTAASSVPLPDFLNKVSDY